MDLIYFEYDLPIIIQLAFILISMLRYRYVLSKEERKTPLDAFGLYFMLNITCVIIFYSFEPTLSFIYILVFLFATLLFLILTLALTPILDKHKKVKRKQILTMVFISLLGILGAVAMVLNFLIKLAPIAD